MQIKRFSFTENALRNTVPRGTAFVAGAAIPPFYCEGEFVAINVSDNDFTREVLASPSPVLLMMWAPWCAYCRMLDPVIDRIAAEHNDRLKVAKLNVDNNPAVCTQYAIQGVPTILMFKNGNLINKMVGVLSKEEIERQLTTVLRVTSGDVVNA